MLEQIDLDVSISKAEYKKRLPELQRRLYDLQHSNFQARIPVAVVFEGWAASGKGGTIGVLTERLDPRGFRVVPITPPRTLESRYPWLWRFWQRIPAAGQMVIYDTSWYRRVLIDRVNGLVKKREWARAYENIRDFEEQLAAGGTIILKFWLHISKKDQARRFRKLLKSELTAWQVTDEDAAQHKKYAKYLAAVEEMLARTDTPHAPWIIVEARDRYHTRLKVIETMIKALEMRTQSESQPVTMSTTPQAVAAPHAALTSSPLDRLSLHQKVERAEYKKELDTLQNQIHLLGYKVYTLKRPVVFVFEGWDAAGKGGVIKRLTERLDPRGYVVHPIAAPTGDDKERHYLYRFWRRLPEAGQIAIFDRSWYGRVLVERVEGICPQAAWMRAFSEINQFERELVEFGAIVMKFWVQISREEQLRRFKEREGTDYKSWKLTDEDWRNRGKWEEYERAVEDMLLKTSTHFAPWTLVEANDKLYARIKVLRTAVDTLARELGCDVEGIGG